MVDINDPNQKPDIKYPTLWSYTVIFETKTDVNTIIKDIISDGRQMRLEFSKFSKDKKYESYNLQVLVKNERERLELFSALKKVAKFVL